MATTQIYKYESMDVYKLLIIVFINFIVHYDRNYIMEYIDKIANKCSGEWQQGASEACCKFVYSLRGQKKSPLLRVGAGAFITPYKKKSSKTIAQGRGLAILQHIEQHYTILSDGNIWNKKKKKFVAQTDNGMGRKKVDLYIESKRFTFKVHRLIAMKYIQNPYDKPEVNHKDGNKNNNDYRNLEWVTREENIKHAIDNKLMWYQK